MVQKRHSLIVCIWFQDCADLGLESTVPMHPQPRPFTLQLFLDFCASTIHQVIWPSPGTLDVTHLYVNPATLTSLSTAWARESRKRKRKKKKKSLSCASKLQCAQCVAVCCSVLQCVAVCCRVLQCVAVCCSVLQCDAVCSSVLQSVLCFQKILENLWKRKKLSWSCASKAIWGGYGAQDRLNYRSLLQKSPTKETIFCKIDL